MTFLEFKTYCVNNYSIESKLRFGQYMYIELYKFNPTLADFIDKEVNLFKRINVDLSVFNLLEKNWDSFKDYEVPPHQKESEIECIYDILSEASEYGLCSEVVYSMLTVLKNNPDLTIDEVITKGYDEWIN